MEIETNITENKIYCLTETQQKYDRLSISQGIAKIESHRENKDKKGGGLMILYKENQTEIEKIETKQKDILYAKCKIATLEIKIVLVYFSTGNSEDDKRRDEKIRKECEDIIQNCSDGEKLIVLGDFNGHIGFIGYQKIDRNGKMILEWMNDFNLILLNGDEKCEGQHTWTRNDQKSTIDYVLMNNNAYHIYESMKIDEEREEMDISDHNLTTVLLKSTEKHDFAKDSWEEIVYYSKKKEDLYIFTKEMEKELLSTEINKIEDMNKLMNKVKEEKLIRTYKRKKGEENQIKEQPWVNEEIRKGIKQRKEFNRRKRNENNTTKKTELEEKYKQKKYEVQRMIKEQITIHEKKETKEIKENKSTKLWDNINKLRNINNKKNENIEIYNDEGEKLSKEEAKEDITKYWGTIYKRHENKIETVWDEQSRKEYMYMQNQKRNGGLESQINDVNIPKELREHFDMAYYITDKPYMMSEPNIDTKKVKKCLKRLKTGKAAGPDGLRPEYYKALLDSKICLDTLVKCYINELERRNKPDEWKTTKTKMKGKEKKPTSKKLRPLTLGNVSCKVYMSLMKNEMEDHIEESNTTEESQAGYSEGGRIEDNLFILQYCVEESFKSKKELIVASIDFKKAFDSVKRESLIEALKYYKIHYKIIDSIVDMYTGDKTIIDLGGGLEQEMEITSGIKQGCTGSTTLFKLVTYQIIQSIQEGGKGFKNETINVGILFYADDALVLANSLEDITHNLKILIDMGQKFGLDINKEKSSIIIYNRKEKPEQIEGIRVVETIKYLGVKINNKRNMFKTQKEEMLQKANRLANLTYSIIAKSCNKVLIGKTYWKSVALPSILYGTNVINLTDTEIEKLQRTENSVYRKILGGVKSTARAALRGDIGASEMKTRLITNKLQYINTMYNGKKGILKTIISDIQEKSNKWWKTIEKYLTETGTTIHTIKTSTKKEIKEIMKKWDTEKWEEEVDSKSSLALYKNYKKVIKEEEVYDNTFASVLLFRARTGTLGVNRQNRHVGGDTNCYYCKDIEENLIHLMLDCPQYNKERIKVKELQKPYIEDREKILGNFLFNENNIDKKKDILYRIWKLRKGGIETETQAK